MKINWNIIVIALWAVVSISIFVFHQNIDQMLIQRGLRDPRAIVSYFQLSVEFTCLIFGLLLLANGANKLLQLSKAKEKDAKYRNTRMRAAGYIVAGILILCVPVMSRMAQQQIMSLTKKKPALNKEDGSF
ncbi:MAG: hypothetical protein ACAH83_08620 [Alphaproteobacteria bacterium]